MGREEDYAVLMPWGTVVPVDAYDWNKWRDKYDILVGYVARDCIVNPNARRSDLYTPVVCRSHGTLYTPHIAICTAFTGSFFGPDGPFYTSINGVDLPQRVYDSPTYREAFVTHDRMLIKFLDKYGGKLEQISRRPYVALPFRELHDATR